MYPDGKENQMINEWTEWKRWSVGAGGKERLFKEWRSKNRTMRVFDDGTKLWHFRQNLPFYYDISVDYRQETSTGDYWSVKTYLYPDIQNQHRRVEIWACGNTRKEAFANFRQRIKDFQLLLTLLNLCK